MGLDMDTDGLSDEAEMYILHTNPSSNNTDGDGLTDGNEFFIYFTDPHIPDTDSDGLLDGEDAYRHDPDADDDGLLDGREVKMAIRIDENSYGYTDPFDNDTDAEGLLDGEEVLEYGTNPLLNDTDGDGLSDYVELDIGLNPLDFDNDGDGKPDRFEVEAGGDVLADPLNPDANRNGVLDGLEQDYDKDGLPDYNETYIYGTDCMVEDTDKDGLDDGKEVEYWWRRGVDPRSDSDGDGIPNILDWDSDNDGMLDGDEVARGEDPMGITCSFTHAGEKYDVIFYVNASISDITYDDENRIISFNVTGPANTTASCTIRVPKDMWPAGDFRVYCNGVPVEINVTEDEEAYYIHFEVELSTKNIIVELADETPPIIGVPIITPLQPVADSDVEVSVDVSDVGVGIDEVLLYYRVAGGAWVSTEMSLIGGMWKATIPGQGLE